MSPRVLRRHNRVTIVWLILWPILRGMRRAICSMTLALSVLATHKQSAVVAMSMYCIDLS